MTADLTHISCTRGKIESEQKIKIKVTAKLIDTNISSVTDEACISCYEENIKNSTLRFMVLMISEADINKNSPLSIRATISCLLHCVFDAFHLEFVKICAQKIICQNLHPKKKRFCLKDCLRHKNTQRKI